jgi:hypothetical protein
MADKIWLECEIDPDYLSRDDSDPSYPIAVSIRCEPDGQLDIFRVTAEALTPDGWLKAQVLADSGVPPLVRILAGKPENFGRLQQEVNYWELCPSKMPRLVDAPQSRPRGKARFVCTLEP